MNKKAFAAVTVFFLVLFVTMLRSITSFQEVSQNIGAVASSLFTTYIAAFELLSLILVGGIIGMLYITGRDD